MPTDRRAANRAVISVPACSSCIRRQPLRCRAPGGFERIELNPGTSPLQSRRLTQEVPTPWLVTTSAAVRLTSRCSIHVKANTRDWPRWRHFLGGATYRALTDVVLKKLAADGVRHRPRQPAHAVALARLRFSVEEAKIELTRAAEAPLFIAGLEVDGQPIDVDLM